MKKFEYPKGLDFFDSIELCQMDEVKLLNRFDTKYWVPLEKMEHILSEIQHHYFVLEINNTRVQQYRTAYFDMVSNCFYNAHHNGKLNRLKIRKREYLNSGIAFLEIKKKNNKGKTSKFRLPVEHAGSRFLKEESEFILKKTGCNTSELSLKSVNAFHRVTLVNRNFNERCTIDFNLSFSSKGKTKSIENLVIIELKQGMQNMKSELSAALKKKHVYRRGFSKYCIGRALSETTLKQNQFKARLLKIEKNFNPVLVSA